MRIQPKSAFCPYCGSERLALIGRKSVPGRTQRADVWHCQTCFLGFSALQRRVRGYCQNGHAMRSQNVKYQLVTYKGVQKRMPRCKRCLLAANRKFRQKRARDKKRMVVEDHVALARKAAVA